MKNSVESVENAAEKKERRNIKVMDLILVIVGVSLLVFTIVMIQLFKVYGTVPDTLITCVFATLGGECGIMGWIKTTKDRNRERKWEQEDKQEAKAEAAEVPPGDMPGRIMRKQKTTEGCGCGPLSFSEETVWNKENFSQWWGRWHRPICRKAESLPA